MADLTDLNKPQITDTEPSVLDTLRGHITRLWRGDYAGMAGLVSGMIKWAITGTTTLSARVYQRNAENTADVEITVFPGMSIGGNAATATTAAACSGNAATASAAKSGSALEAAINSKPTTNQIKGTAVHSAQAWANIKVGEPHFLHPVTADALNVGLPSESNYNEFIKTGYRDLANGWSGISINYLLEDMYFGGAGSGSDLPTWKRVINDTNFSYYAMPKPQTTEVGAISWMYGVISAYVVGTKISGSQITLSDSERSHAASGFFDGRPFSTPGTWELIAWRGTLNGDAKLLKRVN